MRTFYNKYKNNYPNVPEKVKIEYVIAKNDVIRNQVNITDEKMLEYYESAKDIMFQKEDAPTLEYKPFEEVKEQIENTLLLKESDARVDKLIANADNDIYENIDEDGFIDIDFSKLAEKYDLSYVAPTNPNDGTNYFAKEDLTGIVLGLEQFPQLVFDREINDPSPPLNSMEGKLIFRVLERVEPRTPSYEEVSDKVKKDFSYEKAFRKAESLAEKCVEEIKRTSFDEGINLIEEEAGKIQIIETDYFSRPGIFSESNYDIVLGMDSLGLARTGFGLKVGESAIAIESKGEKVCYVVTLVDRKKTNPGKFEEEKDSITQRYLMEKQLALLSEWELWIQKKNPIWKNQKLNLF
jgi:hypothetical protein